MVNTNDKLKMAVNVQKIKDAIFLSQGIYAVVCMQYH